MKKEEITALLRGCAERGQVLEPEAKHILSLAGMAVPALRVAQTPDEALAFAEQLGYPVVAKAVSPLLRFKSEGEGVALGVGHGQQLSEVFHRFARIEGFRGLLVEEMVTGLELAIGASRMDGLSAPMVTLCTCGPGSQVCRETKYLRVPVDARQAQSVLQTWYERLLHEGAGPSVGPGFQELLRFLMAFSTLAEAVAEMVVSVNLNPAVCTPTRCVAVDVRISLAPGFVESHKNRPSEA